MGIIVVDASSTLVDRLWRNKISLESVVIADKTKYGQYVLAVMGRLQVANLAYEKNVFARVTFDNWATYEDCHGSYLKSRADGKTDVFTFGFTFREKKAVDVEFALCCIQGGWATWDNNDGNNYKFHLDENPFK